MPARMTVRCFNNNNGSLALTINQDYIVQEDGDTCYTVINDRGNSRPYLKNHFEVINQPDIPAEEAPVINPVNDPGNQEAFIIEGYVAYKNDAVNTAEFDIDKERLLNTIKNAANNNSGDIWTVLMLSHKEDYTIEIQPALIRQ